ncbi:MAG TPA: DUF1345 domain-containing protein [Steroidobacteraceae bacterium]
MNRPVGRPQSSLAAALAHRPNLLKPIVHHRRFWLAVLGGSVIFLIIPPHWLVLSRVLIAWNATVLLLVPVTHLRMSRLDAGQMRNRYEGEDPTALVILLVTVVAALLSIIAIVAFLSTLKHAGAGERVGHLLLATLTIVDSWLLVATMFTLHYADMYYSAAPDKPPLCFPRTPEPLFWDFAYFSFTIAVACQTADVATTQVGIRRAVIAHSIVSFVFNVSIVGFAINVSAGLLGN